jgi:putative oxidoreductase
MELLWAISGWSKIMDFSGTEHVMGTVFKMPFPAISATLAILVELFLGLAVLIGFCTRPLALALAAYALLTAAIGHHFWTMMGEARFENMENFFKNIAIMGGLLALSASGAGRYSYDRG